MYENTAPVAVEGKSRVIGISSFAFRWATSQSFVSEAPVLDGPQLVRKAAVFGAEVVQLCENIPILQASGSELRKIRTEAERGGVTLEVGFRGLSRESLTHALRACEELGSSLIRIVLGEAEHVADEDAAIRMIEARLRDFEAAGVSIAIENHFRFSPEQIGRIVDTVGSPILGVCLDPMNSLTLFVSPKEAIDCLAPLAMSVHVKDATISRLNTGFYIRGTRIGEGMLDIDRLIGGVSANGRTPNLLVECWMDRCDSETKTLETEEQWVAAGIDFLRRMK